MGDGGPVLQDGGLTGDGPFAERPASGDRAAPIQSGIRAAILEHRLHPGTKLGEDEIGAIYKVSRTIVRAALQALAHEGIVVIEKNRGAFVARPSLTEAIEVFEARKLIEGKIAELAAQRADASTARLLIDHLAKEHAAVHAGDDHAAIRLSGEFHMQIAHLAGHRTLEGFLKKLIARSSLILLLYRRKKAKVCGTDHHVELADAIGRGDGPLAARLMVEHLSDIEAGLDLVEDHSPAPPLAAILRG